MARTIGLHWEFDGSPVLFTVLVLNSWTAFVVAACTGAVLCWLERLLSATAKDLRWLPSQWSSRLKLAVRGLLLVSVLVLRMLCTLILLTYHIGLMLALVNIIIRIGTTDFLPSTPKALSFATAQMSIEHLLSSEAEFPEISYQPLTQGDSRELPQMTSHGLLPLLPLHRSSDPTTNETLGYSQSSSYTAIAQLATPEEGHLIQFPAHHAPTSTQERISATAPLQQHLRKVRPTGLVFLPHESNFTRLDVRLGRFNPHPHQSEPMDEATVPGSGQGKEIARKMFSIKPT